MPLVLVVSIHNMLRDLHDVQFFRPTRICFLLVQHRHNPLLVSIITSTITTTADDDDAAAPASVLGAY